MEQLVRVRKCNADGTAQVIHVRQSACSGDCHRCSGCGAAQETMLLTVYNPIGAKPGQMVIIESETGPVLKAAAVLYMLPLVLFFAGYLLGQALWQMGGLTGCIAFALSVGLVVLYDRRIAKNRKQVYTIVGYGQASGSEGKGDNEFD